MVNGYVDTESNYFMDSRLNLLNQSIYNVAHDAAKLHQQQQHQQQQHLASAATAATNPTQAHTMIDILRVYYEFGPMICGLVNLIDFIPRFYSPTTTLPGASSSADTPQQQPPQPPTSSEHTGPDSLQVKGKIVATESLTRLIRRSLAWFESERKHVLRHTTPAKAKQANRDLREDNDARSEQSEGEDNNLFADLGDHPQPSLATDDDATLASLIEDCNRAIDLKCCNLQVHRKVMLKHQLIQVNSSNALDTIKTRVMAHERPTLNEPIVCQECNTSTASDHVHNWCQHLVELCQPYEVKFVRLAYVVPVHHKYRARSLFKDSSLRTYGISGARQSQDLASGARATTSSASAELFGIPTTTSSSSSSTSTGSSASAPSSEPQSPIDSPASPRVREQVAQSKQLERSKSMASDDLENEVGSILMDEPIQSEPRPGPSKGLSDKQVDVDLAVAAAANGLEGDVCLRQSALAVLAGTNKRHQQGELAHQSGHGGGDLNDAPIGQLTYRLFAPCQLVNSSSCFAINPVNSNSPLARRGSVDLNSSGLSSENAQPSVSLLGPSGGGYTSPNADSMPQVVVSFGAMFPALSHDIMTANSASPASGVSPSNGDSGKTGNSSTAGGSSSTTSGSKFTTNEFESVEAIKRRMEIYVTTNSMKVIAGETLVVNLTDVLSCLSTAIEKTVVRASFAQRSSSTWASVYVLYAAVGEPLLPTQLLASQRLRELSLINEDYDGEQPKSSEEEPEACTATGEPIFDDDFKGSLGATPAAGTTPTQTGATNLGGKAKPKTTATPVITRRPVGDQQNQVRQPQLHVYEQKMAADSESIDDSFISSQPIMDRDERIESGATLFNSAYDRTVALPSPPDNYTRGSLEPLELHSVEYNGLLLNEADLIEAQQRQWPAIEKHHSGRRHRKRKSKRRHEDSQCSIM